MRTHAVRYVITGCAVALSLFTLTWRATGFVFGLLLWSALAAVAALAWHLSRRAAAPLVWPFLPRRMRQALDALRAGETPAEERTRERRTTY